MGRFTECQDEGCPIATEFLGHQSHCLECPFNVCRYERHGGFRTLIKELRDTEIRRRHSEGVGIASLSKEFHVSGRTIQRALRSRDGHWD